MNLQKRSITGNFKASVICIRYQIIAGGAYVLHIIVLRILICTSLKIINGR